MLISLDHQDKTATAADDGLDEARRWRRWLAAFLLTTMVLAAALYASVVLIDPFSTGRFSATSSVDIASRNARLFKAGVARDPRFDAAIIGSSTGYPLDPQWIGHGTGWTVAQLAIPAALPPQQLLVARTFQRHHAGRGTLQIYVMDQLWCRPGDPNAGAWGAFPDWLYESSNAEYLSRIFFPEGVTAAARRLAIWTRIAEPPFRNDGFSPSNQRPIPRTELAALIRPTANADGDELFPALELLAAHANGLPADVHLAFVFAPPFINMLPVAGSAADVRLQACKARVRQIAIQRRKTAYLDLMAENAITRDDANYLDAVHYTPATADAVASAIIEVLKESNLVKR